MTIVENKKIINIVDKLVKNVGGYNALDTASSLLKFINDETHDRIEGAGWPRQRCLDVGTPEITLEIEPPQLPPRHVQDAGRQVCAGQFPRPGLRQPLQQPARRATCIQDRHSCDTLAKRIQNEVIHRRGPEEPDSHRCIVPVGQYVVISVEAARLVAIVRLGFLLIGRHSLPSDSPGAGYAQGQDPHNLEVEIRIWRNMDNFPALERASSYRRQSLSPGRRRT